jgi:hypothetical protein
VNGTERMDGNSSWLVLGGMLKKVEKDSSMDHSCGWLKGGTRDVRLHRKLAACQMIV